MRTLAVSLSGEKPASRPAIRSAIAAIRERLGARKPLRLERPKGIDGCHYVGNFRVVRAWNPIAVVPSNQFLTRVDCGVGD